MSSPLPAAWGDRSAAAVEAVVKKRVPALVVAASMGEREVQDVRGALSLKARFQVLKEDIIQEATLRVLRLHEQEEVWALEAGLKLLGDGAVSPPIDAVVACREVLSERLSVVQRRLAGNTPAAKPSTQEAAKPAPSAEASALQTAKPAPEPAPPRATSLLLSAEYWAQVSGLPVCTDSTTLEGTLAEPLWSRTADALLPECLDGKAWAAKLAESGWTATPVLGEAFAEAARRLHAAARQLRQRAGWPPAFVFMTDEAWRVMAQLQAAVNALMTPAEASTGWEWHLEPSFAAFLLNGGKGQALGDSFPLPHRDHSYGASFDSAGQPKLLSVWVPLTDVATDSGCMYVVPREFDPHFASDGVYEHMQVITEASAAVRAELREGSTGNAPPEMLRTTAICGFPLAGARPLACSRGSMLAWNANLVHWGSFCHGTAEEPRASLALVFRRVARPGEGPKQVVDPGAQPLDLSDGATRASLASVAQRLKYVLAALAYFEHWYDASAVKRRVQEALRCGVDAFPVTAEEAT